MAPRDPSDPATLPTLAARHPEDACSVVPATCCKGWVQAHPTPGGDAYAAMPAGQVPGASQRVVGGAPDTLGRWETAALQRRQGLGAGLN